VVLVSGGTGTLGSAIVRRLIESGRPARVMTRNRARAAPLAALGADVAIADLRDVATLRAACRGVTHVITTANGFVAGGSSSIDAVDGLGNRNLVDAAKQAAVRQFVFTSARLPDAFRAIDYFAAKFAAEAYVRASGLNWTILRPSAFMETWAAIVGEPIVRSGATRIFGAGTLPVNFVAVDDVAAVAVMTLDRPAARNAVVEIGGPENLTLMQVADVFDRITGRTSRRTHVPAAVLRFMGAVLKPFNPVLARQLQAGALIATEPQPFDAALMLASYPVELTRLEDWAAARYRSTSAARSI
jgi:uncharacterized protein YbjT (DUF2867 family)